MAEEGWQPEGMQPDGWQPPGWQPEGQSGETPVLVAVPAERTIAVIGHSRSIRILAGS